MESSLSGILARSAVLLSGSLSFSSLIDASVSQNGEKRLM